MGIKVDSNFCTNLFLATHPEKVFGVGKSMIEGDYATAAAGALGLLDMFLGIANKANKINTINKITTGSAFAASLMVLIDQ